MYDDIILVFAILPLAAFLLPVRMYLDGKKRKDLSKKVKQAMNVLLGLQLAFLTAYIVRIWNSL